jgi:hypothetical protein
MFKAWILVVFFSSHFELSLEIENKYEIRRHGVVTIWQFENEWQFICGGLEIRV